MAKLKERRDILYQNKAPSMVCAQNILAILGSVMNTIRRTYVSNLIVKGLRTLSWSHNVIRRGSRILIPVLN